MGELFPNPSEEEEKERKRREYVAVAERLMARSEGIPFPGINPESYAQLKAADEQFPGYVVPIDELMERFKSEGFKVVFGPYKENVSIQPLNSDDGDKTCCLFPRDLLMSDDMDEDLRRLVELNKK